MSRWITFSLALLAGCGPPSDAARGPTVLLVVVDTWRGDHALEQRADVPLTPFLEEFAQTSVVYGDASSVSNCTSPGTAGILTGLHPHRSTLDRNRSMLPEGIPSLAELLLESGFRTAALLGNPVLRPGMGFERGFGTFEWVRKAELDSKTRAGELLAAAETWLDASAPADSLFLWLQFMEPHGPYRPPEEIDSLFARDAFGPPHEVELLGEGGNSGQGGIPYYQHAPFDPPPTDARDYVARYAAEVRAIDAALRELFASLDRRGRLDDAIVIITSDHGEALDGEHGYYFSHENGLTRDQLNVPLLLRFPGCEEGAVVDDPVSVVDILPTVMALVGAEWEGATDGIDLRDRAARTQLAKHGDVVSVRRGEWKLIRDRAGRETLYRCSAGRETVAVDAARMAELGMLLAEELARPPLAQAKLRAPLRRGH